MPRQAAKGIAINQAHDIISGKRSASDARKMYTEAIAEMKHPEYTAGLLFTPMAGMQGNPRQRLSTP